MPFWFKSLPEKFFSAVTCQVGRALDAQVDSKWLWKGRRVYLFDGTQFRRVDGLPDAMGGAVGPRHLAGDGDAAALVTPDGSLYVSDDGGRRWHQAGGPFSSPAEVRLATETDAGP